MRSLHVLTALGAALSLAVAAAPADAAPPPATSSAHAASSRIDTIMHRLRAVQRFGGVAVSPDGKTLAWTLYGKHGSMLQMADADGSHVRTITIDHAAKGCHDGDMHWSPDGASLVFLSNCNHGKQAAQRDIYRVARDSTRAQRLTHLDGYAHDLAWTPDGNRLSFLYVKGDLHGIAAVSATKPRVGVIGRSGVEHQRIATVPAAGGKATLVTPKSVFVYEYDWAPDSRHLAYIGAPPPGRDNWWTAKLYTQAPGGTPKVILDPNTASGSLHKMQIALPRWSPDGSRIAFISGLMSDQGVTGGDIYVIPASGGSASNVTPGIHITPSWLTWTGRQNLLVSSFAGGSTRLSAFTLDGDKAASQHALVTIPAGISDGSAMSSVAVSRAHRRIAFIHSTFNAPPEIYTASLKTGSGGQLSGVARKPHAVTHANTHVQTMWGQAHSITWKNDGHDVQGWLLFPAHYDAHKHYPMVVYVHGGPTYATRPSWPGDGYGPVPLAAMGYFVLMPNPRGSFGQGEAFTRGVRKDMGYGDLRDILAGVDAVEAKYPVDDKRLGLTGWSYGGFMSMFAPTQTHRFKAAVAGAGLSNWQSYYGENSIDQWMIPFFGASVYQDPKVYAKSSAINFIQNDKTPTLVLVGQYDGETPAPQSFEFWHALRAQNVPTKLVVYRGEGHGFHEKKHRRDVLKRSLSWFHTYLGAQ